MVTNWVEKSLGELFDISGGLSASREQLSVVGTPYLHYGDIHGSKKSFVDVCIDERIPCLDVPLNKVSKGSLLQDGDVVFVDASEDDEGTSRHVVIRNMDNKPFISGLHTIVAKAKTNELDNKYKEYCFQTEAVKAQFKLFAVGTKVTGVNKTSIKNIKIFFPASLAEQQAIATALSDTDELIIALEKLIAKKRAVKQGAMQELLTGKRRLPGFSGKWVEKKINELAEIVSGGTPKTSVSEYWNGNIIWVVPTDITKQCQKYLTSSERMITELGLSQSAAVLLPTGTILLCSRATVGELTIAMQPTTTNQGFKNLICFTETDNEFLYYAIQPLKAKIIEKASGSTFLEISKTALGEIEISVPPTKKEQTAIASILSDMDSEIDVLVAKLTKLKAIKQGMMSELLTGRIRLMEQKALTVPLLKIVESTEQKPAAEKKKQSANVHFKRSVWAAEIADRLYGEPTFGHVKMEKMIFLTENMCNVDIGSNYHRDVAGPYDNRAIRSIDSQLRQQKWFELVRGDKGYRYIPLSKRGGHKEYFNRYYSNVLPIFDKIINMFRTWNTERCEIVATLYSAWKDLENLKQEYTDEDIIYEVLNNWNKSKNRIEKERWQKALNWMRENGFSPIKEESN